jgi:VanZ family protein
LRFFHYPYLLTASCLLLAALLLFAGLWPFNFWTSNHAYLIPGGGGLKFDAPAEHSKRNLGGMVLTSNPLACRSKDICEKGALTVQIEATAENEGRSCQWRMVELRRSDGTEAFFLSQWKSYLIVRSFNTPPTKGEPYREIGVFGALAAGRKSLVTIVSGLRGTDTYLDGQLVKNFPGVRLLKETETLEGHKLYLGNSPELSCPWAGSVMGFAIFGKAVDAPRDQKTLQCISGQEVAAACYRFDNDKLNGESIPDLSGSANDLWKPKYLVFKKPLLGLPNSQSFSLSDVTLNLLGFMPLGFLIFLRLFKTKRMPVRTCLFFAVAVGFAVSLAIELTQVWLPGRDSSLLDLIANTVGSAIGGMLGIKGWRVF